MPSILAEMFRRLPDDGQKFPDDQRKVWMDAFVANLNLVYGDALTFELSFRQDAD